ncbi:MAG: dihydrodipicolinate synthetase [Amnibacterium sp.]|nr:dihydrodipicolinate synthetase [Amnibacterium sp.]
MVSRSLARPAWANTTVLGGDLTAAISELKASGDGELQVHGSAVLVQWLLQHDLVDELHLITIPIVVGQGRRLSPDSRPDIAVEVLESRSDSKGAIIQVYRPTGRPEYPSI